MLFEKIKLGNADLFIYRPDAAVNRPAMLVIPGGGYGAICTEREGEPVAHTFLAKGYVSFLLHYSIYPNAKNNTPLIEASMAMAYIRQNAERFGVDKDKVYAIGFSAGGHLAVSLATLWHREEIVKGANIEYGENKPTAVIACYPVVSGTNHPHFASFQNLTGQVDPTPEMIDYYSLEKHVDKRSAPAYIIHTAEDTLVPVQNSICLARAYAEAGVQFEFHIFPHCDHGFVLGNDLTQKPDGSFNDPQYARFVDDAIYFFKHLK